MLNRSQLLLLTAMATLGGSFAGLLVVGIFANDLTFAAINLVIIVALFSSVFVLYKPESPEDKRFNCSNSENVDSNIRVLYSSEGRIKYFLDGEEVFHNEMNRRAGDIHVGGEVMPEFK